MIRSEEEMLASAMLMYERETRNDAGVECIGCTWEYFGEVADLTDKKFYQAYGRCRTITTDTFSRRGMWPGSK